MTFAELQNIREYIATLPGELRAMYTEQMQVAERVIENQEAHSTDTIKVQAQLLKDIQQRIELGYEAWKSLNG